jgi:hypothetical protein
LSRIQFYPANTEDPLTSLFYKEISARRIVGSMMSSWLHYHSPGLLPGGSGEPIQSVVHGKCKKA